MLPKKERSESLLPDLTGLRPLGTVIRVLDEGSWGEGGSQILTGHLQCALYMTDVAWFTPQTTQEIILLIL